MCRRRDRLWVCVITSAPGPANNHPRKPDQRPHLIASEAARWWERGAQSGGHLRQIGFITFLVTNNRRGPKVAIPNGISSTCVDAGDKKKKKGKWGWRLTLLETTTGSVFDEKQLFCLFSISGQGGGYHLWHSFVDIRTKVGAANKRATTLKSPSVCPQKTASHPRCVSFSVMKPTVPARRQPTNKMLRLA